MDTYRWTAERGFKQWEGKIYNKALKNCEQVATDIFTQLEIA